MRGLHQGWKVTVLSAQADYMSATEPYPVIINNHLAKEGRSIYVATFPLRGVLLYCSTNREVEERRYDRLQGQSI